ncbi:MAG TPA: hypothetical protein PL190_07040 [Caldisericia bacterium]|nr:MAG: hypothetical protein BWX90_00939 [bacterium ADurb.Bin132]HOC80157.1 hypothetical protein [Caldisericia bacterium]HPA66261.1 hypothetical protein [Caldisericia bacterium]HQL68625.1 hypothetical protein [Caldisericia bacterium]HQN37332.1 hypothetical protein [Caldisericia bacterium]
MHKKRIDIVLFYTIILILLIYFAPDIFRTFVPLKLELIDTNRSNGKIIDSLYFYIFRHSPKPIVLDDNKLTIYKDCSLKIPLNRIDLGGSVLSYCIKINPLDTEKIVGTVLSFICTNPDKTKSLVNISFSEDDILHCYKHYSVCKFKTEFDKIVAISFSDEGASVLCESESLLMYGIYNLRRKSEKIGVFKNKTSLHRYIALDMGSSAIGYDGENLCFFKFDSNSLIEISKYPTGYKGMPSDLNFKCLDENYHRFSTYKEYLSVFDGSYLHIFYLNTKTFVQHIKFDYVQQSIEYSLYDTSNGLYYLYIHPGFGKEKIPLVSQLISSKKYNVFLNINSEGEKYIIGSYENGIQSIFLAMNDDKDDADIIDFYKFNDINEKLECIMFNDFEKEIYFYTINKIYRFSILDSIEADYVRSFTKSVPIPAKWINLKNLP